MQFLADDLHVGVEAREQAAEEGEIAFVDLRPGAGRGVEPGDHRPQAQIAGDRTRHGGRRPCPVGLAAPRHPRPGQRIFGEHRELGRRAALEVRFDGGDVAAEDFARLRLVAGVDLDRGAEFQLRVGAERELGAAVGVLARFDSRSSRVLMPPSFSSIRIERISSDVRMSSSPANRSVGRAR